MTMDTRAIATILLRQTMMSELVKSAFKGEESQIVAGLFEAALSKELQAKVLAPHG